MKLYVTEPYILGDVPSQEVFHDPASVSSLDGVAPAQL